MDERLFDQRDFAGLPCLADCEFAAWATMEPLPTELWPADTHIELAFVHRVIGLPATTFGCRSPDISRAISTVASTVGVCACAVYEGDGDQEMRCLALVFANYLASIRMSDGCIVTAIAPGGSLLPNRVVIPHLVGIRHDSGIRDAVIWEWASPTVLAQWTEGRAFDPRFWRERIDNLIMLRRAIRRGEPLAARHAELLRQLTGRYLSFKFVAQHESLVLEAIDDLQKTANAEANFERE